MRILRLGRFKEVIYLKSHNNKSVESGIECLLMTPKSVECGCGQGRVFLWLLFIVEDAHADGLCGRAICSVTEGCGGREERREKIKKKYMGPVHIVPIWWMTVWWMLTCKMFSCFVTHLYAFQTTWHLCSKKRRFITEKKSSAKSVSTNGDKAICRISGERHHTYGLWEHAVGWN